MSKVNTEYNGIVKARFVWKSGYVEYRHVKYPLMPTWKLLMTDEELIGREAFAVNPAYNNGNIICFMLYRYKDGSFEYKEYP